MKKSKLYILGSLLFIIISIGIIFYYNQQLVIRTAVEPVKEEKVTLRFTCSWGGFDSKSEILNEIIANFEKENPDIDIVNESMFGDDFLFTLKTNFASGHGPDVFGLWPGSDRELLIEKGFVADLSELIDANPEWKNNFMEKSFDTTWAKDGVYSIPFEIIYEGLFVNTEVLERYGLEVPQNYGELLHTIQVLNRFDVIPIAYNATPEGSFIYQNIVAQIGGKYDTENPLDENGQIKDAYIEGMYVMRSLYEMGAFPDNAFVLDDVARNDLFMSGQAAMIVQGSWFAGNELKRLEEEVQIVPMPINAKTEDNKAIVYGVGNGNFHINQYSYLDKNKKDAIERFIIYLTSEASGKRFGALPGFMENTNQSSSTDNLLKQKGSNLIKEADEFIGPVDHYIDRTEWEKTLIRLFPQMLDGEIEPEDIFEAMGML